ncbi:hypothetical protein [Melissococcus plutonius]|uniref:hypothetical protein n=1 Tax=Melissococcus plutonius TaxID=33970 RepID=UPI003C3016A8
MKRLKSKNKKSENKESKAKKLENKGVENKKYEFYATNFIFIIFVGLLSCLVTLGICYLINFIMGWNNSKHDVPNLQAWVLIIFYFGSGCLLSRYLFNHPFLFFKVSKILICDDELLDSKFVQNLVDTITLCCTSMLFFNNFANGSNHILVGNSFVKMLLMSSYPVNLGLKILQFEEYNKRKFPKEPITNVLVLSESESNKN